MTLPHTTPSATIKAVRFGVCDSDLITTLLPERTRLNKPLVADVSPNLVRFPFSTQVGRIDDTLRAATDIEIDVTLEADTAVELRIKVRELQAAFRTAEWFITSEGTGIQLQKGKHDFNGNGAVDGLVVRLTGKLSPASTEVFEFGDVLGVML